MISLKEVTFDYALPGGGKVRAIDGMSLNLADGTCVALMGANGSGKSTLVQLMNGILLPASGRVSINGLTTDSQADLPAIRRMVGVLFQNPEDQIVAESVEREIAFGLENLAVPSGQMYSRIDQALEHFGLTALKRVPMRYLSAGEQQRVILASIWVTQPRHIVCDEATSYLDPPSRITLLRHVRSFVAKGKSVLLVTQFPEEALVAERLVLISSGRVIADGRPSKLLSHSSLMAEIGFAPLPVARLERAASHLLVAASG